MIDEPAPGKPETDLNQDIIPTVEEELNQKEAGHMRAHRPANIYRRAIHKLKAPYEYLRLLNNYSRQK